MQILNDFRKKSTPSYLFCVLATTVLCTLVLIFPRQAASISGQSWLVSEAGKTLDQSLARNIEVFATLSSVKALLGVIEGSTVGVSLGASVALQLGDLVQPAYDYFSFVWEIFLGALFLTSIYKLLMESGILDIGIVIAIVGIIGITLSSITTQKCNHVARIARSLTLFGFLLSFGIPIAVLGTEALSNHYLRPLRNKAWDSAQLQLAEMKIAVKDLAAVEDKVSILRPRESFSEVLDAAQTLGERASGIAWETFSSLLYYVSALILELLLLPLLLFIGIRFVLKGCVAALNFARLS